MSLIIRGDSEKNSNGKEGFLWKRGSLKYGRLSPCSSCARNISIKPNIGTAFFTFILAIQQTLLYVSIGEHLKLCMFDVCLRFKSLLEYIND